MEQMELEEDRPVFPTRNVFRKTFIRIAKYALFGASIFLLSFIIFAVSQKPTQCQTVECIQAASHILNYINPTVDPCDDFYKFACGKFHQNNIAFGKKPLIDEMDERIHETVERLLTADNIDDSNFTSNLQVARSFYKACMDRTAINRHQDRTFVETMIKVAGDTDLHKPLWQNATLNARKYGLDFDFFLNVTVAWIQNTHMLVIEPPYVNPNWFKVLWQTYNIEYINKLTQYWNSDRTPEWFLTDPYKMVDFANQFYKILSESTPDYQAPSVEQHIRTISELTETEYLKRDWLGFLQELTGIKTLKNSDKIIYLLGNDTTDNYLTNLHKLMERTQWSAWMNYIVIMNTVEVASLLSRPVQYALQSITPNVYQNSVTDTCLEITQILFDGISDIEYINTLVNIEKQNHVQAMIDNIKLSTLAGVKHILPVKGTHTENVLYEMRNIASMIGSGSQLYNSSRYRQYGKEIVSDNIFDIYFNIKKLDINYFFNYTQLKHAVDKDSLMMGTNMYFRSDNTLYVPAPVLQLPILDLKWPQYLNYGTLGTMIGHELAHALIITYMAYGVNPNNEAESKMSKYKEQFGTCEYHKYLQYLTERHFPTNITTSAMQESMADFAGVDIAYRSYQSWVKEHGPELQLPGLNYTANQIFWIMSSIQLCHDVDEEQPENVQEYLELGIQYNYPVPSYRINGPKQNTPSFARDFSCSMGAKMNPNKKCPPFV